MRVLTLLCALTLISGCQLTDGPSPMPAGYHYHDEAYHSSPGPEPRFDHIDDQHDQINQAQNDE